MSDVSCDRCVHFRPKRRLEDLLKIETHAVSPALKEFRDREGDWEAEESECLLDLLETGQPAWLGRPYVLAYCGREEEDGKSLVYEWKNRDARCPDFQSATGVPHQFCDTCVHVVEGPGLKDDEEDGIRLARLSGHLGAWQANGGNADSGWNHFRNTMKERSERLDAQKTTEMMTVLNAGGTPFAEPQYYDTCRKYSGPHGFELCRIRNYHGRCPGHAQSAPPPVDAAAPAPSRGWAKGRTL